MLFDVIDFVVSDVKFLFYYGKYSFHGYELYLGPEVNFDRINQITSEMYRYNTLKKKSIFFSNTKFIIDIYSV